MRDERGTVSLLAAGILVLVAVLSLVSVDLLRALQARARVQTAADAAALAAAQEIALPSGRDPAEVAAEYAERNSAQLLACGCDPRSKDATVEVQAIASFVFLGPDRTVTARARAVVAGVMGRATPADGGHG